MLTYLSLYLFLAIKSFGGSHRLSNISYFFLLILFSLLIGFRHEIGVDWDQYVVIVDRYKDTPIYQIFDNVEPGYIFLSWIGGKFNNGIYFVNLVSAIIFSTGLLSYSRKREYPWLSILIALPILIITVAMGYTRQACAIGVLFFALLEMEKGRNNSAIFLTFVASTFHISILPMFFLFLKNPIKNLLKVKYIISALIFSYLTYLVVMFKFGDAVLGYYFNYIQNEYSSIGAFYRIFPTLIASLLIVFNKLKFQKYYGEIANLYLKFSYIACLFTLLIIIFPENSTFIDRVALYFTPITLFSFTSVVKLKLIRINRIDFKLLMVSSYFAYTFIWLFFAVHAYAWVPYKNFLFL